ncbi:interleukin-1 family member 10-like [Podarcis muralis]
MEPQKYEPHKVGPQKCEPYEVEAKRKKTWDQEMADLFTAFGPISGPLHPSSTENVHMKREPWLFRFWDINQNYFFLQNNILIAAPQNSNSSDELMVVLPNHSLEEKKRPIFIGLRDKSYTLFCVKSGEGQPQLKLEERKIHQLYEKNEEFKSFTFYSKTEGNGEKCSFQSAEFPDWFISTSPEPNQPVGLSKQDGSANTLFYFEIK